MSLNSPDLVGAALLATTVGANDLRHEKTFMTVQCCGIARFCNAVESTGFMRPRRKPNITFNRHEKQRRFLVLNDEFDLRLMRLHACHLR